LWCEAVASTALQLVDFVQSLTLAEFSLRLLSPPVLLTWMLLFRLLATNLAATMK